MGENGRRPPTLGEEARLEKPKGKLVKGWSEQGARSRNSLRYLPLSFRRGEGEVGLQGS